ncbi:hypothetical protein IVB18_17440 [Bradyrhizobium sp. 186]|uniref:hypothetical protein n=1 Tax=Bradyrhizobium sp. 186 TaxID=2782654 RepID=UPI0020008ECF|nr:hypothetical protein [Bradyrhizobium sp. 186]UPK38869.1 hypothetical protein IVB18_17440 [Bradyrhizobium sp. 186]
MTTPAVTAKRTARRFAKKALRHLVGDDPFENKRLFVVVLEHLPSKGAFARI